MIYADPPRIFLQIMAPKKNEMMQALLSQKVKDKSKPDVDYAKMDLESLGQIRLEAGRKNPGKTFKEIYEMDDSYNQWVLSHVEEDSWSDKGVPLYCHYLCRRLKEEVSLEEKDQPQGSDRPPSVSKDAGYKTKAEQQLAEMKKAANLKGRPGSQEDEDLETWSKVDDLEVTMQTMHINMHDMSQRMLQIESTLSQLVGFLQQGSGVPPQ